MIRMQTVKIDRCDKHGEQLKVGDKIASVYNAEIFEVVFATDILAFGIEDKNGHFEFMTEWVESDWVKVA